MGTPSVVSRAQGNIILELDGDTPPTKVLVDHIAASKGEILPVQKDTEFYLGVVDQDVRLSMKPYVKVLSADSSSNHTDSSMPS